MRDVNNPITRGSFWSELKKNDRIKLIYSYVLSPIIIMLTEAGTLASDLYAKYGYEQKWIYSFSNRVSLILMIVGYLPQILPPTIIRFVCLRRRLNYGLELYLYMLLSLVISLFLIFYIAGITPFSFGLLGTLAFYCVLSYRSDMPNTMSRTLRYILTFLTIAVPFLIPFIMDKVDKTGYFNYFPIWEGFFLAVMLNSHKSTSKVKAVPNTITSQEIPQKEASTHRPGFGGYFTNTYRDNKLTSEHEHIPSSATVIRPDTASSQPATAPKYGREPLAQDLLLTLAKGAGVYLSNAITLESARWQGKPYVDVYGASPEQREAAIELGARVIDFQDKTHLLIPITGIRAMTQLLGDAKVVNIFDRPFNDLDVAPAPQLKQPEPPKLTAPQTPAEYAKYLATQPDFLEFCKWLTGRMQKRGVKTKNGQTLTVKAVQAGLLKSLKSGDNTNNHKIISGWYHEFQQEK